MDRGMESKKILIIGEHSYIGKNLAQVWEERGYQAVLVGAKNGAWKKIEMSSFDSVVIAAALVHRKEKKTEKELYYKINCELPVAIAKKAKASGVHQVVFLSSMAVFGNQYEKITMQTEPKPESLYGKTKYQAEQKLKKLETEEFHVAIVRPPMVYGSCCKGNYERLKQLSKITFLFPDTQNKRSMIEVETLSKIMADLIERKERGIVHPQDKEYINTAHLVKKMREDMGKKTYLTKSLNWLLIPLAKKIGIFRKIFGNLWYEK